MRQTAVKARLDLTDQWRRTRDGAAHPGTSGQWSHVAKCLAQCRHVRGELGEVIGMVGHTDIHRIVVEGARRAGHMLS